MRRGRGASPRALRLSLGRDGRRDDHGRVRSRGALGWHPVAPARAWFRSHGEGSKVFRREFARLGRSVGPYQVLYRARRQLLGRAIALTNEEEGVQMSTEVKKSLHEVRFPGESDEYRRARNQLLQSEIDLRRQIEAVAAQRRKLPLGGIVPRDSTFEEWDAGKNAPKPVRLSELFEDGKDTLFLYSHMFIPGKAGLPLEQGCPSCTSIIDAIDGTARHVS